MLATVDASCVKAFVVVSRPRVERFQLCGGAAHFRSVVDERVEIDIPQGTFEEGVTISMEVGRY